VGVFQGGSAKLICESKGDRSLHLFDTFEGLPEPEACDEGRFHGGQYRGGADAVREYLKNYRDVSICAGYFPDTAGPLRERVFSLVHLDVDLYRSTLDCLEFFYPRMLQGGIIISHDYNNATGVRRAFAEFFAGKPEPILEVALSQALVVKV
jgi:O-methyltransferase